MKTMGPRAETPFEAALLPLHRGASHFHTIRHGARQQDLGLLVAAGCCAAMLLGSPGWATVDPCNGTQEARDVLTAIRTEFGDCTEPGAACQKEKIRRLATARDRFPGEIQVHRDYQDAARIDDLDALKEEYRELEERHPGSALYAYFYARLHIGEDLMSAVEHALELDPDDPWIQLALSAAHGMKQPPEVEASFAAARRFLDACPNRFREGLSLVGRMGPPEFWRPHVEQWRPLIEAAPLVDQATSLPRLWNAEFQLSSPEEFDSLRKQVRKDLARLETEHDNTTLPAGLRLSVLSSGYKLLGDEDRLAELDAERARQTPCSTLVAVQRTKSWYEAAGLDQTSADPLSVEQAEKLLADTAAWLQQCPDSFFYTSTRFNALRALENLEHDRVVAEVDQHLGIWEKSKGRVNSASSPYIQSARLLLDRGVALDRVADLVAREREYQAERQNREGDLPAAFKARMAKWQKQSDLGVDLVELRAKIALEPGESLFTELDALETRAEELATESESDDTMALRLHSQVLAQRAELQNSLGNPLDAAVTLTAAIDAFGAPTGPVETWEGPAAEYRSRALELWQIAGGSAETYGRAFDRPPTASRSNDEAAAQKEGETTVASAGTTGNWEVTKRPLSPFELVDLDGRKWTLDDLSGRTVLINLWATWCGPCRVELPHLQDLADEITERDDLMVLTFNTDQNPGVIDPYLEKEGLKLNVLLAHRYVMDQEGGLSLPQNWIVDQTGVVRRVQVGFGSDGEGWRRSVLAELESVAATSDG